MKERSNQTSSNINIYFIIASSRMLTFEDMTLITAHLPLLSSLTTLHLFGGKCGHIEWIKDTDRGEGEKASEGKEDGNGIEINII